jgi:catechol-2,3-dioxygenase
MSSTAGSGEVFQTGHIGLNVTDIERSTRFYKQVFGFDTLSESGDPERQFVFLGAGKKIVLTLWQQADGAFSPRTSGLHHLSFQVDTIEEVQAATARLREIGATLFHGGVVPHAEGAQSGGVFFADPDGTRMEIYAPSGADTGVVAPTPGAPTCGFF